MRHSYPLERQGVSHRVITIVCAAYRIALYASDGSFCSVSNASFDSVLIRRSTMEIVYSNQICFSKSTRPNCFLNGTISLRGGVLGTNIVLFTPRNIS